MNIATGQPRRIESYVHGEWVAGAGDGVTMLDAATGAPVARVDTTGVDFVSALDHGRDTGGPALRDMTFHQRALILKALARALMDGKEEFYGLSAATGATRSDSWIDIEGGIGTLFSYASLGRRELPNAKWLCDGQPEALSRDDSFSAQHILSPLEGVAVHINAFNFPCWGMLEKFAPTFWPGCRRSSSRQARRPI